MKGVLLILVTIVSSSASAGDRPIRDQTAEALLALAPRIALDHLDYETLHIALSAKPSPMLSFELWVERAKHFALIVRDADQTPLSVHLDHHALIYDAPDGVVLWGEDESVRLTFEDHGPARGLDIGVNYDTATENGGLVDVKSVLDAESALSTTDEPDGSYTLVGSTPKSTLTARVDPKQLCAFQRLELKSNAAPTIFLSLTIAANEPLPLKRWAFPSREHMMKSKVRVIAVPDLLPDPKRRYMEGSVRSVLWRLALRDREARKKYENMLPANPDWAAAARTDATLSRVMRTLVNQITTAPATQAADPKSK